MGSEPGGPATVNVSAPGSSRSSMRRNGQQRPLGRDEGGDALARAGFSLDELIARAQAMRAWLLTARGCECETLDVCALFDADADAPPA
jgi:hypothetical protein